MCARGGASRALTLVNNTSHPLTSDNTHFTLIIAHFATLVAETRLGDETRFDYICANHVMVRRCGVAASEHQGAGLAEDGPIDFVVFHVSVLPDEIVVCQPLDFHAGCPLGIQVEAAHHIPCGELLGQVGEALEGHALAQDVDAGLLQLAVEIVLGQGAEEMACQHTT